jgi:hypothetical protein
MITADKVMRVVGFLTVNQNAKFEWGRMDCNIMTVILNDILTGNRTLPRIYAQYHCLRTAIRFQRNFLSAGQYLHQNGWQDITDQLLPVQDFDVLTVTDKNFTLSHFAYGNRIWSMDNKLGMCNCTIESMPEYKHWRLTNG